MKIKDYLPKEASFYEDTWVVIVYMVKTDKQHLTLDIQLKTSNQYQDRQFDRL